MITIENNFYEELNKCMLHSENPVNDCWFCCCWRRGGGGGGSVGGHCGGCCGGVMDY